MHAHARINTRTQSQKYMSSFLSGPKCQFAGLCRTCKGCDIINQNPDQGVTVKGVVINISSAGNLFCKKENHLDCCCFTWRTSVFCSLFFPFSQSSFVATSICMKVDKKRATLSGISLKWESSSSEQVLGHVFCFRCIIFLFKWRLISKGFHSLFAVSLCQWCTSNCWK